MNKDTSYSLEYHEKTKHSEISVMTSHHYLDWDNRPYPFKLYPNLEPIQLPKDFSVPSMNAILAISTVVNTHNMYYKNKDNNQNNTKFAEKLNKTFEDIKDNNKSKSNIITLKELAEILFFSAGITRAIKYNNDTYYMRAASATGALYPIEVYIVCADILPDLKSGIYHFNPALFSLVPIRYGDFRTLLSSITAGGEDNNGISNSPFTIILTSFAWRNAWKYQDRSYRHWFWDAGVIAANTLATITSSSISTNANARIYAGFIDDKVNELLALENEKEAAIAIISMEMKSKSNFNNKTKYAQIEKLDYNKLRSVSLSRNEKKFPLIWKAYESSKLFTTEEVKEWVNSGKSQLNNHSISSNNELPTTASHKEIKKRFGIPNEYHQVSDTPNLGETILKRGSARKFARSAIEFLTLSSILFNSTRGIPTDFKTDQQTLIDIYLIVNNVKGIEPGGYFYNRSQNSMDLIIEKASRNISGYLCLGQSLFSDAGAVLFLMSNLNKVLKVLGNRGYRAAQFEAGIIAGKIYLLSYANAIGASGSTFYDDAVTEFFLPHSENKNTMIAVGVGNPAYKSRSGKILPVILSKEHLVEKAKF